MEAVMVWNCKMLAVPVTAVQADASTLCQICSESFPARKVSLPVFQWECVPWETWGQRCWTGDGLLGGFLPLGLGRGTNLQL